MRLDACPGMCELITRLLKKAEESGGRMKKKIRVGIIGVGNCASSLVQGVEFYQKR